MAALSVDFFDASALVRVFTDEPGSDRVRPYFNGRPTKYTTPFCFYETLSALKGKWRHRGQLTEAQYLEAAFRLTVWYGATTRSGIKDLNFTDPLTFGRARGIVERTSLDLSDAFQILSVKYGFFSPLIGDSSTVLVTADRALAEAARGEGLKVWSVLDEDAP